MPRRLYPLIFFFGDNLAKSYIVIAKDVTLWDLYAEFCLESKLDCYDSAGFALPVSTTCECRRCCARELDKPNNQVPLFSGYG